MPVPVVAASIARDAADAQVRFLDEQDARLIRLWSGLWGELEPELLAELERIFDKKKIGNLPAWELAKSRRIALAIQQAHDRLLALLNDYGANLTAALPEQVQLALQTHQELVQAQLPDGYALTAQYVDVNAGALDAIVQRATGQIEAAHKALAAQVQDTMKANLIRGVALGDNPRKVASRIIKQTGRAFTGGLPRATMIAATEMIDAARTAQQEFEKLNTDVLEGWVWLCALDARSCPSCVAMHGSVHPLDEQGPLDHHRGRCTRVPRTVPWSTLGVQARDTRPVIQTGEEWYQDQDEATQKKIMGPARWQKLNDGTASFADLSTRKSTDGWRDAYHVTPVKNL